MIDDRPAITNHDHFPIIHLCWYADLPLVKNILLSFSILSNNKQENKIYSFI